MAELTEKSATDKAQKVVEQKKQKLSAEEMLETSTYWFRRISSNRCSFFILHVQSITE